jgi:hypothetical protein
LQNKKHQLFFLSQILKIGFKKYQHLYLIMILSLCSILIEIVAMSLISSISSNKYIIMGDYLSSIDSKFIFIIVVFLFIIRFISVFFIENYQVLIARKFQSYLSTESLEKVLFHSMSEIEK